MHYQEYHPPNPLGRFVKCIWTMEGAGEPGPGVERILPDGCSELVFNLADSFVQHSLDGTLRRQPGNLLVGQMRQHILIQPTGRVNLVGVRFWPGGAYPFLNVPQDELAGSVLDAGDVLGNSTRHIASRVGDGATADLRAKQAESALVEMSRRSRCREDEPLSQAIGLILRTGGQVSIRYLADQMGTTLRSLDRRFNARVGLTPKALSRIIRFQRVVRALEHKRANRDLLRVALDCGYYDQSHFNREFKEIAGAEPTSYFSTSNAMSEHFTRES